jgi:hypothetical protein
VPTDSDDVIRDDAASTTGCSRRSRWQRLRDLSGAQWVGLVQTAGLLPLVRFWLWRRGFGATSARLAARSEGNIRSRPDTFGADMAEAVALVAGRPLIGSRCLARSLVLWFLLRRRGVDAVVVIGAAPPEGTTLPAHAWVEVAGEPVNDRADIGERFGRFDLSLPRLSPRPEETQLDDQRGNRG